MFLRVPTHRFLMLRNILNGFSQMLSRTTHEQTTFLFKLYDINGDGQLDCNEIMYMLLSTQEMTDPTAAMVVSVMSQLDSSGNGRIEETEFVNRGARNMLIMRALDRWFQVKRRVVAAPQLVFDTVRGEPISKLLQVSFAEGSMAEAAQAAPNVRCPAACAMSRSLWHLTRHLCPLPGIPVGFTAEFCEPRWHVAQRISGRGSRIPHCSAPTRHDLLSSYELPPAWWQESPPWQ